MTRLRLLCANLALFCAACLLFCAAAEAALRLTGTRPPEFVTLEKYGNVNLLYRPGSQTRWRGNLGRVLEFDTPITVNSIAQFDLERKVPKPESVYRIVLLGDSYVEALQVPLEKGAARLIEDALNRDPEVARLGKSIEVVKLGGSGNGALRAFELLTLHGPSLEPDFVLAFFTDSNDFDDDWHYLKRKTGQVEYRHVNLKPPAETLDKLEDYKRLLILPGSWLNRWVAFGVTRWRERNRSRRLDVQNWKELLGAYALPGSGRFEDQAARWKEAARITSVSHLKSRELAESFGARYAVAFVDRQQTYRPGAYRYLYRIFPGIEREIDLDRPVRLMRNFLTRNAIPWFDLNPVFERQFKTGRSGHYAHDGHWNDDGHRWTAEALTPFIKERILDAFKA